MPKTVNTVQTLIKKKKKSSLTDVLGMMPMMAPGVAGRMGGHLDRLLHLPVAAALGEAAGAHLDRAAGRRRRRSRGVPRLLGRRGRLLLARQPGHGGHHLGRAGPPGPGLHCCGAAPTATASGQPICCVGASSLQTAAVLCNRIETGVQFVYMVSDPCYRSD